MAIVQLNQLGTESATDPAVTKANVLASLKRPFPRVHHLPEFGKPKRGAPIALAGGGPSIRRHVEELREFDCIMSVGSAHDFVVDQGIAPRYCIIADGHETIVASYLQRPNHLTTYLVATQCDNSVFDALAGHPIAMWHCLGENAGSWLDEIEPGWQGLGGGCTAGLRAISMAMILGFRNIHLFGYDSCIPQEGETHAYNLQNPDEEHEGLGRIFNIKVGINGAGEKSYMCHGYQLAQAQNFETFLGAHYRHVDLTFHGEGLLKDVYEMAMSNIDGTILKAAIEGLGEFLRSMAPALKAAA